MSCGFPSEQGREAASPHQTGGSDVVLELARDKLEKEESETS